jgi:outer membrane lipoprotein carrier protein
MTKIGILSIILSVLLQLVPTTHSAFAQLESFSCRPSATVTAASAKEILQRVQAQYMQVQAMRGGFRQDSYVAALDEGEISSGQMVFAKPGKMRWSYKTPRIQEVIVRDGELWMYQPDKEQVLIDDIGNVLLSALPISFLMGIGNVTKDFDLVSACRSSAGLVVKLVPHKKETKAGVAEGLEGFDLLVDEAKNVPQGAKITSVGGNVTAIVFENLQLNSSSAAEERFVLEYPKGVDILDKREKAK